MTLHQISCLGNHDPLIVVQLMKLIRKIKPHVVQTWLLQMDVFGGLASRLSGVPWILSERCSAKMYGDHWKFSLRRQLGRLASAIVANSGAGLEYWASVSHSPLNRVICNVIPFDEIESSAQVGEALLNLNDVDQLIVVAGRYSAQKNLFVLLQALDKTLSERPLAHVVFFGTGELEHELKTARNQLYCAARIHILAYTERLYHWMKRAAVYVSASQFEGNPNTVLEAIACRCPVVISDIPEHREILDSRYAVMVDQDSAEVIANGLGSVLDNPAEAKMRAETAYLQFRQWTPEYVARQYMQLYDEVLKENFA